MLLQKTEGIVLKSIKYSDTSIITKIFTREFGEYSFIIRGVRGKNNKSKSNIFQPLQILELDIYYHPDKNILKLREYRPAFIYQKIYTDIVTQSTAIFMLETISKCIQEHEVNTELYDFFRMKLTDIDIQGQITPLDPQLYLLGLVEILGITPSTEQSNANLLGYFNLETALFEPEPSYYQICLNQKDSQLFHSFINKEEITYTKSERLKILDALINYFKIHISGFKQLNSLEIIRQLLN